MAETKFELVSTLVKLMKKAGIEDTVAFTNLGSLTVEQLKEQIAEYEERIGDTGPVKTETPVPTPEKGEPAPSQKAPKAAKAPKRRTVKGGGKKKKKTTEQKAPAADVSTSEVAPAPVDVEMFKTLMAEAISPLSQRVNKLEDQVRVAANIAATLEDRYDERITALRKGIEELQGNNTDDGDDDDVRSLYKFLDKLARAAGYACDVIEESEPE